MSDSTCVECYNADKWVEVVHTEWFLKQSINPNQQPKESVKEVKSCDNCGNCLADDRKRTRYFNVKVCKICVKQSKWIPIDSVSALSVNPHPIVIEYENLGDTVKIVKIEGVMTHEEILRHAGHSIAEMYFGHGLCMWKTGNILTVENGSETFSCKLKQIMKIGDKIEKEMFFIAIDKMERSAKRLASLIKEFKEPEIKRIVI
jgi:hypothetical protein